MKFLFSVLICTFCLSSTAQHVEKENLVGTVLSLYSNALGDDREIQIYLPGSYTTSNLHYPVLYVLDGQRYFLSAVGYEKSFVEFKESSEFIVVGISRKRTDRNVLYSTDSGKFLEFIKNEVISYVDANYRTSRKRMLFGWAYAGGFVLETMSIAPDLFDTFIAASPYPLDNKLDLIDSLLLSYPTMNNTLFFSSGSQEGVVLEGVNKLNSLLEKGAPSSLNWVCKALEGEEHRSTPYTTLYHGIKKSFEYYPELQFNNLDEFLNAGGLNFVSDYYKERARRYNFPESLSDWTMFSITRNAIRANNLHYFNILMNEFNKSGFLERLRLSRSVLIADFYTSNNQLDMAIDIFSMLVSIHPEAPQPLKRLGDIYTELEKEDEALEYYRRANKLSN